MKCRLIYIAEKFEGDLSVKIKLNESCYDPLKAFSHRGFVLINSDTLDDTKKCLIEHFRYLMEGEGIEDRGKKRCDLLFANNILKNKEIKRFTKEEAESELMVINGKSIASYDAGYVEWYIGVDGEFIHNLINSSENSFSNFSDENIQEKIYQISESKRSEFLDELDMAIDSYIYEIERIERLSKGVVRISDFHTFPALSAENAARLLKNVYPGRLRGDIEFYIMRRLQSYEIVGVLTKPLIEKVTKILSPLHIGEIIEKKYQNKL